MTNYFDKVEAEVRIALENPRQSVAHEWGHVSRVRANALEIARAYSEADREVLEMACLLHDVVQPFDDKKNHVQKSLEFAETILKRLAYPKIKPVLACIREHSTEDLVRQSSLEAKILFDADKLDGFGEVGAARVFLYCGQNRLKLGQAIKWYERKIGVALPNMQTPEGKKLLKPRLRFTRSFLSKVKEQNRIRAIR